MLREGYPVKAQGAFKDDVFVAGRIKFYPPDKNLDPVIRGRIDEVEGTAIDGRFRIERLWVRVHHKTDWLIPGLDLGRDRLAREEVAQLLGAGSEQAYRTGYRLDLQFYDLASDPQERNPLEAHPMQDRHAAELGSFGARLVDRRVYGADDEALLSAESIRELRAIGYVE